MNIAKTTQQELSHMASSCIVNRQLTLLKAPISETLQSHISRNFRRKIIHSHDHRHSIKTPPMQPTNDNFCQRILLTAAAAGTRHPLQENCKCSSILQLRRYRQTTSQFRQLRQDNILLKPETGRYVAPVFQLGIWSSIDVFYLRLCAPLETVSRYWIYNEVGGAEMKPESISSMYFPARCFPDNVISIQKTQKNNTIAWSTTTITSNFHNATTVSIKMLRVRFIVTDDGFRDSYSAQKSQSKVN